MMILDRGTHDRISALRWKFLESCGMNRIAHRANTRTSIYWNILVTTGTRHHIRLTSSFVDEATFLNARARKAFWFCSKSLHVLFHPNL